MTAHDRYIRLIQADEQWRFGLLLYAPESFRVLRLYAIRKCRMVEFHDAERHDATIKAEECPVCLATVNEGLD